MKRRQEYLVTQGTTTSAGATTSIVVRLYCRPVPWWKFWVR